MSNVEEGAVVTVQEVSKQPARWMQFPRGYADIDGERLWGCYLGDGTAVLFYLNVHNEAYMVRVSDEDAKEVQERHCGLQDALCWYEELPWEHKHSFVLNSLIDVDLFAAITEFEMPCEPKPLWAKRIETRRNTAERRDDARGTSR